MAKKAKAQPATSGKSGSFAPGKILHSVFHGGRIYDKGDESALAEAGFSEATMQHMADRGLISGFGTESAGDSEGSE